MQESLEELCKFLDSSGVVATELDRERSIGVEREWRAIFGNAFVGREPFRQGTKAEAEFQRIECSHFWIVTLSSKVAGTPIHPTGSGQFGIECRGGLLSLSRFHALEFFISPIDFAWTMVHTHEDHASGGPFFAWRS